MMLKNAVCRLHKLAQDLCILAACGQYCADLLAEVIVRRSKADALISACDCTAMWRKEWPRFTFMPAFSARGANSGSLNSAVTIASDTSPSMEPAE